MRCSALSFGQSKFNVALHIRRGDILATGMVPKPGDLTSQADILACVRTVMARSPSHAKLHVFSQGSPSDFDFLGSWRPRLHIEEEQGANREAQTRAIASVFHHLVSADALIIAKSSLSQTAGYLSQGRVYTPDRPNHTKHRLATRAMHLIAGLEACV